MMYTSKGVGCSGTRQATSLVTVTVDGNTDTPTVSGTSSQPESSVRPNTSENVKGAEGAPRAYKPMRKPELVFTESVSEPSTALTLAICAALVSMHVLSTMTKIRIPVCNQQA